MFYAVIKQDSNSEKLIAALIKTHRHWNETFSITKNMQKLQGSLFELDVVKNKTIIHASERFTFFLEFSVSSK